MTQSTRRALLVIDLQNDYFPGGKYPLWNTDGTLQRVESAIQRARQAGDTVILIQHVANAPKGAAPFFNEGSEGVDIHPRIRQAAPEAPVVVKHHADSFFDTDLEKRLQEQGVEALWVCGMMTQNCVTHTAISKAAEPYQVAVLADCCTTVDEMIHKIALNALTTRVTVVSSDEVLPAVE